MNDQKKTVDEDFYYYLPWNHRFQDLRFIFSGREACRPLHSWGPAVRPNYIIHFILAGKGIYRVGAQTWELHENQGFLIEPEVQTFYQADGDMPWTYCWVGFDGRLVPEMLSQMGLGGGRLTFSCDAGKELEQIFEDILSGSRFQAANELLLESHLYRFFAVLMKNLSLLVESRHAQKNSYVQGAMRYIRGNYFRPIQIADIAAYLGIDRSYLFTLFKNETGMTPSEYLANFRLTKAGELLRLTDYSIETIAISCGYPDPQAFSKAFKRKFHCTPVRYRRGEAERQ